MVTWGYSTKYETDFRVTSIKFRMLAAKIHVEITWSINFLLHTIARAGDLNVLQSPDTGCLCAAVSAIIYPYQLL